MRSETTEAEGGDEAGAPESKRDGRDRTGPEPTRAGARGGRGGEEKGKRRRGERERKERERDGGKREEAGRGRDGREGKEGKEAGNPKGAQKETTATEINRTLNQKQSSDC